MVVMDKIAYSSKLLEQSPAFKAGLALSSLVAVLAAGENIFSLAIFCVMTFLCVKVSGLSAKSYIKLCLVPFWFLLLGAVTISISFTPQPVGMFNFAIFNSYMIITRAGLLQALNMFLKAMAGVSCLYFMYVTTPVNELLGLLDKVHTPKLLTELMMMIYRFIFILINMAEQMLAAQKARLGGSGFRASFRSFSVLASSLFVGAFQKSEQIYNAMESRGYDGDFAFTGELTPMTREQKIIFMLYIPALIAAVVYVKLL